MTSGIASSWPFAHDKGSPAAEEFAPPFGGGFGKWVGIFVPEAPNPGAFVQFLRATNCEPPED